MDRKTVIVDRMTAFNLLISWIASLTHRTQDRIHKPPWASNREMDTLRRLLLTFNFDTGCIAFTTPLALNRCRRTCYETLESSGKLSYIDSGALVWLEKVKLLLIIQIHSNALQEYDPGPVRLLLLYAYYMAFIIRTNRFYHISQILQLCQWQGLWANLQEPFERWMNEPTRTTV